jgi:superfamily II DNA helicase RecQ
VPLVGLTAMASPATVELLRGTVCAWDVVVRASTVRPGVRYAVLPVRSKTEAASTTVHLVRGAAAGAKHLVFCMTICELEHVARALPAEKVPAMAYHDALPAEEEAGDAAFRGAVSGARAGAGTAAPPFVAVCTAGYGLGLDIPDVVETVHYGVRAALQPLWRSLGGWDGERRGEARRRARSFFVRQSERRRWARVLG